MKRKKYFDFPSDEKKHEFLTEIIGFFETERNEEIGFIAAEEVLDFFLDTLGKDIYNKGLKDAQKIIREKTDELSADIEFIIAKREER